MQKLLEFLRSRRALGAVYEEFIKAKRPLWTASTLESNRKTLTPLIAFIGRGRDVRRITLRDLIEFGAEHLYRDDLSPYTTRRRIKEIRSFFNWMVKVGYLDQSPASNLEMVRLPDVDNAEKAIPPEHLQKILDVFFHSRARQDVCRYAMLVFMADTGARVGGVASLKVPHVHILERWALVHHKGRKQDKLFFGEECAHALNDWALRRGKREHDYFFCHPKGPYQAQSISIFIRRACRALGLPDYSGHNFRHTMAQRMQASRIREEIIAAALGDTVEVARRHYLATYHAEVEEAARETATPLRTDRKIRMLK